MGIVTTNSGASQHVKRILIDCKCALSIPDVWPPKDVPHGLFYYRVCVCMCVYIYWPQANDYVESYYEVVAQIVGDKVVTGEEKQLRIKEVEAFLKDNSAAGGVVCLCCIILNLLCGHCSSILMGYKYTTRRTMLVSNFMTWVLGITTSRTP
jgi:hypothetical protein